MINKIYTKYNNINNDQWLMLLLNSVRNDKIDGIEFPGFPDDQTQINFVGSANEQAIKEIWSYYKLIHKVARENGISFNDKTTLLDVGSGWGRVIRCFLKDIQPDNLYGIDTMQSSVDLCNKLFSNTLNFKHIQTLPPIHFDDARFDIIEGYSVVSHLSRLSGLKWLDEYWRILKPGGLLALTVWKSDHFNVISEWQRTIATLEGYPKSIARAYTPGCSVERKIFNALGFDYKLYKGGIEGNEENTYGEAIMSPDYIKKYWCRNFDFISYIESAEMPQAFVVLQKPSKKELVSYIDSVRREQYEMANQLDLFNKITFEIATETRIKNEKSENDEFNVDSNFTPEIGYRKLTVNHLNAAIKAFKNGVNRKIELNPWLLKIKKILTRFRNSA